MRILTITYSKNHKIFRFLGIKIKLRDASISALNTLTEKCNYMQDRLFSCSKQILQAYSSILKMESVHPKVLLFEPNFDAHSEVLPGYLSYFLNLGYHVDVLMIQKNFDLGALERFKFNRNVTFFTIDAEQVNDFFAIPEINEFDAIFITSEIMYWPLVNMETYKHAEQTSMKHFIIRNNEHGMPIESIFVCFPNLYQYYKKCIVVEHHLERCPPPLINDKKVVSLSRNDITKRHNISVINPHDFGPIKRVKKTNNFTTFIIVGGIQSFRKNVQILFDAVEWLNNLKITNFKIIVVGYGELNCKEELKHFFDIKGRISYPEMYNLLEKSHFILPLFDPQNKDHDRYITRGTSGIYQLIYGFKIPCIIHKKFAVPHGLNVSNSMIYNQNKHLAKTMLRCIKMNSSEYDKYINNLDKTAKKIYKDSQLELEILLKNLGK